MRPITPQLITETLRLMRCTARVSAEKLQKALMISKDRSREILNQMSEMALITDEGGGFKIADLGIILFQASLENNFKSIHRIFSRYPPYVDVYARLKKGAVKIDKLSSELGMSRVAVDVILRLIDWAAPDLTRNPHTDRYYLADGNTVRESEFIKILSEVYEDLSAPSYFGMRRLYIAIPTLRNYVCERLGINKQNFNFHLTNAINSRAGEIELASASNLDISKKGQQPFYLNPRGRPYFYIRIEEKMT